MNIQHSKYLPALALGILTLAATAQADLITSTADLPPPGVYLSTNVHAIYGGAALEYLLTLPAHAPIVAEIGRRSGGNGSPGTPADEIETFGSNLDAMIEIRSNGVTQVGPSPIHSSGPFGSVQTLVVGKIGQTVGSFDTEMLALSLSGTFLGQPFLIRESPTKQSTGHTTITPLPGGQFQINSFFDVFTELSLDNGATWMPSHDSAGAPYAGHVTLEAVPEPASMSLLAAGVVGMMGLVRRRR